MGLPIPCSEIINLPMDEFNDLLSKHELTEEQLTLCRDIRRRGKNKVRPSCRVTQGIMLSLSGCCTELQEEEDRPDQAAGDRGYQDQVPQDRAGHWSWEVVAAESNLVRPGEEVAWLCSQGKPPPHQNQGMAQSCLQELGHDPLHWQLQMDHNRQVHILPRTGGPPIAGPGPLPAGGLQGELGPQDQHHEQAVNMASNPKVSCKYHKWKSLSHSLNYLQGSRGYDIGGRGHGGQVPHAPSPLHHQSQIHQNSSWNAIPSQTQCKPQWLKVIVNNNERWKILVILKVWQTLDSQLSKVLLVFSLAVEMHSLDPLALGTRQHIVIWFFNETVWQ